MRLKAIGISTFVLALLTVLSTQLFVWIPDILADRVIVLGQMETSDGDYFKATQQFVGDGYLTRFDHTNRSGQSWHAVFDGDAFKAWSAKFEQTNNTVTIRVLNRSFFYNLDNHGMTYPNGAVRAIDEKAAALTDTTDLFRVAFDEPSGKYACVSKDGRVLACKDGAGRLLWTNDIAATFGANPQMDFGGRIDSLERIGNEIVIYI
jgi:hypothetical protein